jgi:regulator of RNase E activity RraA
MSAFSEIQPVSAEILNRLEECDTPTVCNVVELWDLHRRNNGYMDSSIAACFPEMPSMVGYALTSTFRSMSPPRGGDVYSGIAQQVEAFAELPGPPVVVYQDLDLPVASATFGEVMCTTYKTFGAKGIITSGAGRDLKEVQDLGFPAFTSGTICAHGYCHTLAVNVPVTVGGLPRRPAARRPQRSHHDSASDRLGSSRRLQRVDGGGEDHSRLPQRRQPDRRRLRRSAGRMRSDDRQTIQTPERRRLILRHGIRLGTAPAPEHVTSPTCGRGRALRQGRRALWADCGE